MEVVCLILGHMLASQPCSHAFGVLMSLHLFFIYIENVFLLFLYDICLLLRNLSRNIKLYYGLQLFCLSIRLLRLAIILMVKVL